MKNALVVNDWPTHFPNLENCPLRKPFGIASKELAEAVLKKEGALHGMKGFLPAVACFGRVTGPAMVYRLI